MVESSTVMSLIDARSAEICAALEALDLDALAAPSALPGWSRLTVACHLRYGAQASHQMIDATFVGHRSAFYPAGRELQRPHTLHPALGEHALHVPASLRDECGVLAHSWRGIGADDWSRPLVVDLDDPETLRVTVEEFALLRLTEVMVHGTDLDLGLSAWPPEFGRLVLAQRTERLGEWPGRSAATWLLDAVDAPSRAITVDSNGHRSVRRATASDNHEAHVRLCGTANELVAVLLGRACTDTVDISGDVQLRADLGDWIAGP